jgi:DNA-binding protein YbaB
MEETITLKSIETKQTKSGAPMWTATTSTGKMSCFDKNLADQLFTLVNKNIIVEVEMQGQYKNLKRVVGMAQFAPIPTAQQAQQVHFEDPKMKSRLSSGTMCISYAKDLCIAGKIELKDIPSKAKEFLSLYEEMLDAKFV